MRGEIQLRLLIGAVPIPAPPALVEALTTAKVDMGSGSTPSGFELHFDIPLRSRLPELFLGVPSAASKVPPFVRVVLLVLISGRAESLIDGMVTHVEAEPTQSGNAQLTILGTDLSTLMHRAELPGTPFGAMSPSARVKSILSKYEAFGVRPVVIATPIEASPVPADRVPQQRGTDYGYVRRLAKDVGYVFFFEAGAAPGTSTAYWGPETRDGTAQPALTTGMDALNTVDQLNFKFDREHKEIPQVYVQDPVTKRTRSVPIPSDSSLDPPLGLVPSLPARAVHLSDTAHLTFAEAQMRGVAHAVQKGDAIAGTGQLDITRYGHVLRSRRLVAVRGAGAHHNGVYYVTRVTHELARGSYKQSFELSRNALVSTVSTVPI